MSPGAKLEVTLLHVEWEPSYIDVAGTLQDACREVMGNLLLAQNMFLAVLVISFQNGPSDAKILY